MSEEEKVADFQSLTGVPPAVARNMLEATDWDIQVQLHPTTTSGD
jgi:UBA-like domain